MNLFFAFSPSHISKTTINIMHVFVRNINIIEVCMNDTKIIDDTRIVQSVTLDIAKQFHSSTNIS